MAEEKKFYLTGEGLEKLKQEYEVLRKIRVAKTNGEAPKILESEDLNPEYISFQEDLEFLETRISELENVFKNVVKIKAPSKDSRNMVELGAKVMVEIDGKEEDEFEIVGTLEANPSLGRISNESPVGKAILGHRMGEQIVVSSPISTVYKIKRIKYGEN